jgi:hypothetical protein
MRLQLVVAGLALLLAGCDTVSGVEHAAVQSVRRQVPGEPEREVLGISAARPDAGATAPDEAVTGQLDWKARQLCTNGYDIARQDFESAEANRQLVDWQVLCRPYRVAFIKTPKFVERVAAHLPELPPLPELPDLPDITLPDLPF